MDKKLENSVKKIDKFVKNFMKKNTQIEAIVISPELTQYINRFKLIIDSASETELDYFAENYSSFYIFAKFVEKLAGACKDGSFDDILKIEV